MHLVYKPDVAMNIAKTLLEIYTRLYNGKATYDEIFKRNCCNGLCYASCMHFDFSESIAFETVLSKVLKKLTNRYWWPTPVELMWRRALVVEAHKKALKPRIEALQQVIEFLTPYVEDQQKRVEHG